MPINSCSNNGKPGYKWGDQGMCYTYTEGNEQSMKQAKNKARLQGIAARLNGYKEKANEVTTGTMGSGIKNPQQGYKPKKKKKKENFGKSLDRWFSERWVDISRPKKGGGFEPCGRSDAESGKYPKCVPAARAARMTPAQIASAVRRKRRAESTQTRQDKKPINVSTDVEKASRNVPTNPELYARVKAEAKRKFDVYPSAYANAWLVREYKKRGGGYRTVSKSEEIVFNKVADDLDEQEAVLADMLIAITRIYGKFNEDETGVWAGYDSPENNDVADIGVKCSNCIMYEGEGVCKIISQMVEPEGKCRFAIIPDGVVEVKNDEEDEEDEMQDKAMMEDMPGNNEEGEDNGEDEEEEDDELDLKPRQKMHYEVLESIAEEYGKWDQTSGANGAHYAPASENPFKKQGMICANCVFYEGGQGCEIVSGTIEPEAICKLWIIDESLISESK